MVARSVHGVSQRLWRQRAIAGIVKRTEQRMQVAVLHAWQRANSSVQCYETCSQEAQAL